MVNWGDAWLHEKDANGIKYSRWAKRQDYEYASCLLCMKKIKYSLTGIQALRQHSSKEVHKKISNTRFSETERHLFRQQPESAAASAPLLLDHSFESKVRAAEAKYLFKLAQADHSFR